MAESNLVQRERITFRKIPKVIDPPNLVEIQTKSYQWLVTQGLAQAFREMNPIEDFTGNLVVEFGDHSLSEPKFSIDECRDRDVTYAAPLTVQMRFLNRETGEIKEQAVFMGEFPVMTPWGTFVINGTERVVVSQLVRSPGVYFDAEVEKTSDRMLYFAKVIPSRGAWLEMEIDKYGLAGVRIDRKRKYSATMLLKALGVGTAEDILKIFDNNAIIQATLAKDVADTKEEALIDLYKRLRPGEPPTPESARSHLESLFFSGARYDLAKVGRYKINKKLEVDVPIDTTVLTTNDVIATIKYLVGLPDGEGEIDDIDHFGNRRIRTLGELIQNQFRVGLSRMERVIRERMNTLEVETITPQALVNIRPVVASVKEFFGSSQLSQFMDQTNPLTGLTHKRRLSALGPGGLSRERAGFEVRDVHPSHYGRMCPIETPEGPNIGLIGTLSTFGRVNEFGFVETPYRKVVNSKVTDEIVYMTADEEEKYTIAQANTPFDVKTRKITAERVLVRKKPEVDYIPPAEVDLMDISADQSVSVAAALIPFLEHNDANRALMGANMQRQAVPLLVTEAPLVGTGLERRVVQDTGEVIIAPEDGKVTRVDAEKIVLKSKKNTHEIRLKKFGRSNQGTCINQRPVVEENMEVKAGQVLADGAATSRGELALGRNLLVAFMPWGGYNYEDAIVISERLVKDDVLTSVHIEEHEVEARDTKLGPEEITREIVNVSEEALKDLDEEGIIRIGAEVGPGDILVGKVTPKGETELTAEERLLRAIFGEKAREVRDTSLKVPHGEAGTVIGVRTFSREANDELSPGVNKLVRVYVAQKRKISEGDKLAGRHGNKGVIAKILPLEDMPFLEDGTPVDIILNPLGVPSRMNLGQILETHLGWAAGKGWSENGENSNRVFVATPVFQGATEEEIRECLVKAGLPDDGKAVLYDGRSGEPFSSRITVGQIYVLKLLHLVDDKIHARSTGPYSLVTQQPLGGKAQFGGQRFGEMEVWALEAYGSAYTLQEILTVKSDDVAGRVRTYESIVKGENIPEPGIPESFKVLVKEMQSLGLSIEVISSEGQEIVLKDVGEDVYEAAEELGIDLRARMMPEEDLEAFSQMSITESEPEQQKEETEE